MDNFITELETEAALNYLRDTAKDYAIWKSRARFLELHRKSIRAAEAESYNDGAMNAKLNKAEASEKYMNVVADLEQAMYESILLEARRNAAEAKINAWQTMSANNRQGLIS